MMSDNEILLHIQQDNDVNAAIHALYAQFSYTVHGYIRNNGGSLEDSEDIFQETILTFLSLVKENKFRGDASIKTFLVSIARNLWLKAWNKRHNEGKRDKIFEISRASEDEDLSIHLQEREIKQQLLKTLDRLDSSCKKLLMAFYYDSVPLKDLAGELGYANEQVVRNKKYKCMKALTDLLKDAKDLTA